MSVLTQRRKGAKAQRDDGLPAQFKTTDRDRKKIMALAKRAVGLAAANGVAYDLLTADMDLTACHCNGMPLDLDKLAKADDFNFAHDVFGIRSHINRHSGKIENFFVPRCAKS